MSKSMITYHVMFLLAVISFSLTLFFAPFDDPNWGLFWGFTLLCYIGLGFIFAYFIFADLVMLLAKRAVKLSNQRS